MSNATIPRSEHPRPRSAPWKVDAAHTRFGFSVKHMGVATVRGYFEEVDGTLTIGDDLASAKIVGTAKAASVQTGVTQRDDHLRSAGFLRCRELPGAGLRVDQHRGDRR